MQTQEIKNMNQAKSSGEFNRFTKFPESIRKCDAQPKNQKESENFVSTTSKLVFLYLIYYKDACGESRTPTYEFMSNRFGIGSNAYDKAIKELASVGAIEKTVLQKRNYGVLSIKINKSFVDNSPFEKIPCFLIDSDVYTNNQKIFIACLWKLFMKETFLKDYSVELSDRSITEKMIPIGFSKNVVYKMLKEISDQTKGFVPFLDKRKKGYGINYKSVCAIADRNSHRWNQASLSLNSSYRYPIYEKPLPFDFKYIETEDGAYIVENRQERIAPIIKKLTNACETFEEAKARFEKEQEEYED